jgi:hypothetical protein
MVSLSQNDRPRGVHCLVDSASKRAQTKTQRGTAQVDVSRQRSERHGLAATDHAPKSVLDVPVKPLRVVAEFEGSATGTKNQGRRCRIPMNARGRPKRHHPAVTLLGDDAASDEASPHEIPHAERHPSIREGPKPGVVSCGKPRARIMKTLIEARHG